MTQPNEHENILELQGINKFFYMKKNFFGREPKQVLSSVSFVIQKGETVALVGESGSGKSTTARIILGLEKPSQGKIIFNGLNIEQASKAEQMTIKRNLQIVFQDPSGSVNPRRNIEQTVSEPLLTHGYTRSEAKKIVLDLLDLVGLNARDLLKYPHQFSGGQLQRIGIVRAIVLKPQLVILDEPTSALDVSVQARILKLLRKLQVEMGLTYLFITHDLNVVKAFADRVLVMYKGRIVETGMAEEIFHSPQHPYTKELLQSKLL